MYPRDTSSNIYLVLRYKSWWPHRRSEERNLKKITEIHDNQLKYRLFIYLFIYYIKQVRSTLSFFFVLSCRVMSYSIVFTLSCAFFVTDRNVACIDVTGVFVTLYFFQQNTRVIICKQTQSFVQFLLKFSTVFLIVWNAKKCQELLRFQRKIQNLDSNIIYSQDLSSPLPKSPTLKRLLIPE